ncbi:hypothetical protein Nmel_002224 [Mimus melanotis]
MTRFFGIEVIMVMGITDIDDKIIKRANEPEGFCEFWRSAVCRDHERQYVQHVGQFLEGAEHHLAAMSAPWKALSGPSLSPTGKLTLCVGMSISPVALARIYEEDFKQDMAALKVLPPTVYMRVTDNIPQIISFIKTIISSGQAYATSQGNVYFDVKSWGNRYGVLTAINPDTQDEAVDSDKRHGKDFALWKAAKTQELSWNSPWGKGRPGWHIECSTISSAVFGKQLDIHTGGIDLAFPHHENEIAQCEVYHQCEQWGNYFLHSGHLHVKGSKEKMSKSLKNYITIKDFLKKCSSDQFRMFCLRGRYSSAVEFSEESMEDAKNLLQSVSSFIRDANAYIKGELVCDPVREDILWERLANTKVTVKAAFADDFDTSRAVAAIMDLIHHGNRQLKAVTKCFLNRMLDLLEALLCMEALFPI